MTPLLIMVNNFYYDYINQSIWQTMMQDFTGFRSIDQSESVRRHKINFGKITTPLMVPTCTEKVLSGFKYTLTRIPDFRIIYTYSHIYHSNRILFIYKNQNFIPAYLKKTT